MTEEVKRRLTRARTHLLLDSPWFGSLSLRLKIIEDGSQTQTISTNGSQMIYNPDYLSERSDDEIQALVAHEVMHCALAHPYRGKGRNWRGWNQACDIVINKQLRDQGFKLPFTELQLEEEQYKGMTAEQVYAKRHQEDEGQGEEQTGGLSICCDMQPAPQKSKSKSDEGGEGGESDQSGEFETDSESMSEADWQIAAEQASSIAKRAGNMPGDIDRAIQAARETPTDWRTILRRFIEQTVPSDYSWTHPNRRYIAQGIYLPGVVKENLPRIGVAVDTSGSIDSEMLRQFANELTQIVHEARPESVEVIYVDTKVQGVEIFTPDDPEVRLEAKGGGGTNFQPAINHFKQNPPVCMIYLTDLYASEPEEPEFPVLWAVPEWQSKDGWFGETVRLIKEEK